MKVKGEGSIHFFDAVDEGPHQPDDNEDWQESVVLYVWDPAQGVYAFFRAGQEPGHGLAALWSNIWVPGEYFKHYDAPALRDEDRIENGLGAGETCRYVFDGNHNWSIDDGDVKAELVMKDFHPGFGFIPESAGALSDSVAKNHIEAAGKVTGTLTFKGKTFELTDAIGYRDHSWGIRKWDMMRCHRWTPAIFGPDLSILALSWYSPDGHVAKVGYAIRDDELIVPKDIDIVCYSEIDSITHRGGKTRLTLEDGEVLECEYEPVAPGGVSFHHGYPCVDTLCTTRMGDREGVGVFEAGYNTMGGKEKPHPNALVNGKIENGIFAI